MLSARCCWWWLAAQRFFKGEADYPTDPEEQGEGNASLSGNKIGESSASRAQHQEKRRQRQQERLSSITQSFQSGFTPGALFWRLLFFRFAFVQRAQDLGVLVSLTR